jgi:hypothetical protein
MLQALVILYLGLYLPMAAGLVREFTSSVSAVVLARTGSANDIGPELERPEYAPYLFLFGLSIGLAENCLIVSLLSTTRKKGERPRRLLTIRCFWELQFLDRP